MKNGESTEQSSAIPTWTSIASVRSRSLGTSTRDTSQFKAGITKILEEEGIAPERVQWHCFSGPQEWGPKLAEKGYYISIPSSAYGFNRWRRNIKGVPLENLLTETDSCFQHPFKMGAFNTPTNVKYALAAIAYVNEMEQQEVAERILGNAKRFFGVS